MSLLSKHKLLNDVIVLLQMFITGGWDEFCQVKTKTFLSVRVWSEKIIHPILAGLDHNDLAGFSQG